VIKDSILIIFFLSLTVVVVNDFKRSTLAKEIKSWKGFEYALRKPNAILFNKMLKECLENEEYTSACIQNQRATVFCRIFVYGFNISAAENDK
jgi:hypothetical protein